MKVLALGRRDRAGRLVAVLAQVAAADLLVTPAVVALAGLAVGLDQEITVVVEKALVLVIVVLTTTDKNQQRKNR
tara:strand:+ start:476 stop:700 length:225 start_codon:yes stop_codon:yes gene_type:complete